VIRKKYRGNVSRLVRELEKVSEVPRIRISSIEPDLLNDDIIDIIASSGKFMPHFHIPLQSGSGKILKLMKRKYDRELFASRSVRSAGFFRCMYRNRCDRRISG